MYRPKRITNRGRSSRDRLLLDLADRGIDYFKLPPGLFDHRVRDVLEWLKQHYHLSYCYRCQHLIEPTDLAGTNLCNKHKKEDEIYDPPPEILEVFRRRMDQHVIEDMAPTPTPMRQDIERIHQAKQKDDVVERMLKATHTRKDKADESIS